MRRQKRASCTNSDYEKMANLGDKGRFWQKWRVCQKFIKGLAKYSNEMTKSDKFGKTLSKVWQKFLKSWLKRCQKGASWQMAIITEMANLATIHKVWQKLNEMTNEACWLFAIFAKMTNLVKIANLAISNEWLAKNSNEMAKNGLLVIRDFYEDSKWQIWEEYMKGLNKIQTSGQ